MPGRLIMDQKGAIGSTEFKKDRSKAQEVDLPARPDSVQQVRSMNGALANGADAHLPTTNGQFRSSPGPAGPPQLDQSWRESDSNKSMGAMIDRLASQCFEDLTTRATGMAEMPLPPEDMSRADDVALSKKRDFLEFAQGQRVAFIKVLVLSDWARRSGDDIAKLVDIKIWQDKQSGGQINAMRSIGQSRHDVASYKIQNPNIESALHLLSTGNALSKVPHMGFIKQKRLTAQQLLRTIQGMNVTLTTRLNLHEELPPHFNNFSIADGRATFHVDGEFDVDLTIANEELSSSFYFIDIRFTFSPAPKALEERILGELEMRVNAELSTNGLLGCYQLLHNFVLTHKLVVIKDQAQKLIAEKWFECLGVEWKDRVLVLNYWTGRPGKKSWLEFGISSGKKEFERSRQPATPLLTVRWFRRGQLVEKDSLHVDWKTLDTEKILADVISKHSAWLLTEMKSGLEQLAGTSSKLSINMATTSSTAPEDCVLTTQLPSMQSALSIRVEPVTGTISLSPSSERAISIEKSLQSDAQGNAPQLLGYLLCKSIEERVSKAAELAGWQALDPRSIKQDNFKTMFGASIINSKPYICSDAWNNGWIVLVTYSLSGEAWWVARLEQKTSDPANPPLRIVATARQIPMSGTLAAKSCISRSALLQIEKLAASEVSFTTLSQQLTSMQIPHKIEKQASLTFERYSARVNTLPAMAVYFRGDALLKDSRGKSLAISCVQITHQGILHQARKDGENAESRQELQLNVEKSKFSHLKEHLASRGRDANVTVTDSGALAVRLRTPFGQPYCDKVLGRLHACDRLDRYLATLQHFQFECTTANFHKLTFTYSQSPNLRASFTFPHGDGCTSATLRLEPADSNPHHRTRVLLEKLFNSPKLHDPFTVLCKTLAHSTGVMQAFEQMETANMSSRALSIHPRNPLLFTFSYQAPLAALSFRAELIDRKEKSRTITCWKIKAEKTQQELATFEAGRAIVELSRQSSKFWYGFGDGTLVALSSSAVAEVLTKVDDIMRNSSPSLGGETKQESAAKPDVKPATSTPASGTQKAQQQQSSQQKVDQQKPPQPAKPMQLKPNGLGVNGGPRTMTPTTNASLNMNNARNNQSKFKKEVIELD